MAALFIARNARRRAMRRERVFRDRIDPLDNLDDVDLIQRYRLPRRLILDIVEQIQGDLNHPTKRSQALPAHLQVMIALRYMAKGCFLSETADVHGVSRASASRCITSVSMALCRAFQEVITFPSTDVDVRTTKEKFYNISQFPNVVGVVDGTLIPITAPHEDEPAYVCRKNFHAVNVQAVADADMKFINVVSRWPGSVHDAFIWTNCSLSRRLERGEIDGWILGDSGYALRPWLLTPKRQVLTPGDRRYNKAFKATRCIVERAFGVLKSRFRCLHKSGGCMLFSPEKCCSVILATFKLHNICITHNLPLPDLLDNDDDSDDDDDDYIYNGVLNDGETTRQNLIAARFSN